MKAPRVSWSISPGGENLSLSEYEEVVQIITANADDDALIIPGSVFDPDLEDEIRVTVVATGFKADAVGSETAAAEEENEDEIIKYKDWARDPR